VNEGRETDNAENRRKADRRPADGPMTMRHADVNGIRIAYDVLGSGPPLVLIMGYRLSSLAWPLDFIEALAAKFTVVLFDNRGTGASDKPTTGYEISNMARDVSGLLDHLEIARTNVLGYSMGGAIAQEFVRQFPDRVLGLVLCATMCGGPRATYAPPSVVRVMRELDGLTPEEIARQIWSVTYAPGYIENHRELAENQMRREIAAPTPLHAADLQYQAFAEFDCATALPNIQAPTLVMTGDLDRLVSPQNSKFIAGLIPGARLIVIPGCGHRMMWEATDECVGFVTEFLTGVYDGRRNLTLPFSQGDQNPLGDFVNFFTPAVEFFTTWPWMLAGVGADTMTVARQSVYFGGKAQFGDGKPIILVPQLDSGLPFLLLSNWLKVLGYRPATTSLSAKFDDQVVDDLIRGTTRRIGRKAVLVASESGMQLASAIAEAHSDRVSDVVVLNASSHHPDAPPGIRSHFISSGWSLFPSLAALPQVLRNIPIELIEAQGSVVPETGHRGEPHTKHA
jgi:pimeloyl-ACP methyl ester carboxylesterase